MHTFSNHVASIRSICKIALNKEKNEYLVMSAGSRMQAHIYKAKFTLDSA